MFQSDLNPFLEPGALVTSPANPDWGPGQVQSKVGARVTVNFREAGKVVVDGTVVMLVPWVETTKIQP